MKIKSLIITLIIFVVINASPLLVKDGVAEGKSSGTLSLDEQQLIRELQKGGYVIYFRHTATEQKTVQWDNIDLQDCATQRNLSELGRQQSLGIGAAFSSLGINVTRVVSSPFCRCIETGKLAFGTVEISHDLLFSPGSDKLLEAKLGKMLRTKPLADGNTVLISHSSNLRETTGIDPKPEGVAVIFKPQDDGSFSYVAMVRPDGWDDFLKEK